MEAKWAEQLKLLHIKSGPQFFKYFTKNWLHTNWINAWRNLRQTLDHKGRTNTNNSVESLFRLLTHSFLNTKKANALNTLALILHKGFISHFMVMWAQQASSIYIPLSRSKKARLATQAQGRATLGKYHHNIKEMMEASWRIRRYHIDVKFASCTCPFAIYTGKTCKHIHTIELLIEGEEGDKQDVEMYQSAIDPTLFINGKESDPNEMDGKIHAHLGQLD